jgi:N-acetylneuraminate synthase
MLCALKRLELQMSRTIKIADRSIGPSHRPFIIAEMSGNHNQSLDRALAIVEAAAKAGAHGLKLQTYTADTMTLDLDRDEFFIDDPNSLWKGRSLHKLYQEAYTPWEWHKPIFDRARSLGMIPFSTPFDDTAVDFLEELGVPCYKIASFENTDLPLIRRVAATGKPMIISTGMATVADIDEAVRAAHEAGCKDLILLKCTSTYPATPSDTNILTIPHMRALFGCEVGLSDHTFGIGAGVASVALGATVIEKHFTLARADGGVDSTFSMEPDEMAALVVETERAWMALGEVRYGLSEKEKKSLIFRRSLYVAEDLAPGDALTEKNLRIIRPGLGLPPKYFETLLGKRVGRAVRKGTPMSWDLLTSTEDAAPVERQSRNARA